VSEAREYFERKNQVRERALTLSRELTHHCALTIRAVHRREVDQARQLLGLASQEAQQLGRDMLDHADLFYSGYTQDALKEWAEASITFALINGEQLPTPEELAVIPSTYLRGLGEAVGELRRYILDTLRRGEVGRCEELLTMMDDVYSVLVTIDYPDALTGGLRRTTDMVRGVLERTRGDLTVAARQDAMQRSLRTFAERIGAAPDSVVGLDLPEAGSETSDEEL